MTNSSIAKGMGMKVMFTRCKMNGNHFTIATPEYSKKAALVVDGKVSKYIKVIR
jgi:hypothetical protein